ncbi:MAG TPA: hypothetical protein EYQ00_10390 [Dehalococcoidia bacterium]|nr:hypothetical protein [Dehalococcoidia bacterium]
MNKVSTGLDAAVPFFALYEHTDEHQDQANIILTRSEWPDGSVLIDKDEQDVSRFWILGHKRSKFSSPNQRGGIGWRKYATIIFIIGAIALIIILVIDDKTSSTEPEWIVTNENEFRPLPHGHEARSEFYTLSHRFIDKFEASCATEILCRNGISYSVSIPYFAETGNIARLSLVVGFQ